MSAPWPVALQEWSDRRLLGGGRGDQGCQGDGRRRELRARLRLPQRRPLRRRRAAVQRVLYASGWRRRLLLRRWLLQRLDADARASGPRAMVASTFPDLESSGVVS